MTNRPGVGPLNHKEPMVDKDGRPTPEFMRKWVQQNKFNGDVSTLKTEVDALRAKQIIAGDGLVGGGTLGDPGNITISLDPLKPWHPQGYLGGRPLPGEAIFRLVVRAGYGFILNSPRSRFKLDTPATAPATFDVRQNGVSIGSVVFPAANLIGTLTLAAVTFEDYDKFEFIAPTVQDATLAGVSFLFIGFRKDNDNSKAGYGELYGYGYGG